MDWTALSQKAKDLSSTAREKAIAYTATAKTYTAKAVDFTANQLWNTPLYIKDIATYEWVQHDKKLIILAVDSTADVYTAQMLKIPMYMTSAWTLSATFRIIDIAKSPDIVRKLDIQNAPALIVSYQSTEYARYTSLADISAWFDSPCFYVEPKEEK